MMPVLLLSQAQDFPWTSITNVGVAGAMLFWFATRVEGRLDRIEHRLAAVNRTLLMELLTRDLADDIREMAQGMINKMDGEKSAKD